MTKRAATIFAVMAGLCLPAPLAMAASYARLIANSNYKHWEPLKTPERDVERLARVWTEKYQFAEPVILRDATRGQIIDELEAMKSRITENDDLLIYYAGHGHLRRDGGYWIGIDANLNSRGSWINYTELSDLVDYQAGTRARHVLVGADSCYSGAALRSRGPLKQALLDNRATWLSSVNDKRSRTVVTSGGTEPVLDGVGNSPHSVFAGEFLDRLEQSSVILGAEGLHDLLKSDVHERASRLVSNAQAPEYGVIYGTGHDGGDFLFVPVGMSVPKSVAPPASNDLFALRGPSRVVFRHSGLSHLGDENIRSFGPLRGPCHIASFEYPERIDSITLRYDLFGTENAHVQANGIRVSLAAQDRRGRDRPNYWQNGFVTKLETGQLPMTSSPVSLSICAEPVTHKPERPGDLDDFVLRNLEVTVN